MPPSPPAIPPPKPSRLFKLAIVGDGSHNRLVPLLIHRTLMDEEGSTLDGMSNASSSFISVASSKNSSELMYRKKDISLCHNGREICVRLQIYSVDCHYDVITDGNPTIGGILDKCQAVLFAVRAPLPSSSRMDHRPSSSIILLLDSFDVNKHTWRMTRIGHIAIEHRVVGRSSLLSFQQSQLYFNCIDPRRGCYAHLLSATLDRIAY
jgi:hypothetical protein